MESIWDKDYVNYNCNEINENINTPILIIGGGLAGLMCAYNFMKNNIDFILVEAKLLAKGITSKTTAQLSVAHNILYNEINKKHGPQKTKEYLKNQINALNTLKEIIKNENIECDYHEESTIILANNKKNVKILKDLYQLFNEITDCNLLDESNNIFPNKCGLEFKNQAIINPNKFLMKIIDILLKKQIKLFENSKVTKINKLNNGYEVIINNKYLINTKKIIMSCHYPFLNPDNLYFTKIYQSKSYSIAFKTNVKINNNYLTTDKPYYYLRTYDHNTLIIGGSDHYSGINIDFNKCYQSLINKIYELDPKSTILFKWSAEDCIVIDSLPFVGHYSKNKTDILLITGFQKWGFTNSIVAAKTVTDIILNKKIDNIYKTNRVVLFKDLKGSLRLVAHSVNGLLLSRLFIKNYQLLNMEINSGIVTKYRNKNVLIYRENKNKFIILKNKCTHMGCTLIWNDTEKVWESKCHGSIFDPYGNVIYGPAIKSLELIEVKNI